MKLGFYVDITCQGSIANGIDQCSISKQQIGGRGQTMGATHDDVKPGGIYSSQGGNRHCLGWECMDIVDERAYYMIVLHE